MSQPFRVRLAPDSGSQHVFGDWEPCQASNAVRAAKQAADEVPRRCPSEVDGKRYLVEVEGAGKVRRYRLTARFKKSLKWGAEVL